MNDQLKLINTETGEVQTFPPQDPKALAKLFGKLARVMGRLERLHKSGHNTHFNYDFVTDADVSDAIRSTLADEGIAFFANIHSAERVVVGQDTKGRDRWKTIVHCNFIFADSETGATWASDWQGEAIDDQDKGTAKAATSALKYFLLKNFILSTGDPSDDSDGDAPAQAGRKTREKSPGAEAKPSSNGNLERAKAAFFARVLSEIPYYKHANHVTNALKNAGFTTYSEAQEEELFAALQEYANQAANEEAA